MDSALMFFGLVWALLGRATGGATAPSSVPSSVPRTAPPSSTPPVYPGPGWEYDEPPPTAVRERARALLGELWARGKGSYQLEQTGGRWIAYVAEITRGKKRGVVAYRRRGSSPPLAPRPALPSAHPAAVLTSSPGMPQPTGTPASTIEVQAGKWYQFRALVDAPAGLSPEEVGKAIALGGGVDITVSRERPHVATFVQRVKLTHVVPIGAPIPVPLPGGHKGTLVFQSVKEVRPIEAAPGAAAPPAAPAAPMRMLKFGDGMKPQAPQSDVALLQVRLGINPADGRFGNVTKAAVRKYQGSHGLQVDGIVGPATWRSILGVRA